MYIGIDTHKKQHVSVALDANGRKVGTYTSANTADGWARTLRWAAAWEGRIWGIENSGSWGKGLAQFLLGQGEAEVREVSPHRTAQYRRRGRTQDKTDETDALAIARLLAAEGEGLPRVARDDASTELRLLSDHRDNLQGERTRLINQLHAQMLQLDPGYEEKSGRLTTRRGIVYCRDLTPPDEGALTRTRLLIVRQLAAQILRLDEEIAALTAEVRHRVEASGTALTAVCGVGILGAARLIGDLGSTPRISSAAALAALTGVAPVAVSSGGRNGYRLNRGGNRQLNRVVHSIALSQRRYDPRAKAYDEKKRAEGKTARAALRCLKRRIVDILFRALQGGPTGIAAGVAA
jgi:transposase